MTPTSISRAIYTVAENDGIYGTYNLSTGSGLSVREAVISMLEVAKFKVDLKIFEQGNSLSPRIVGNNSKLLKTAPNLDLTWNPLNEK